MGIKPFFSAYCMGKVQRKQLTTDEQRYKVAHGIAVSLPVYLIQMRIAIYPLF